MLRHEAEMGLKKPKHKTGHSIIKAFTTKKVLQFLVIPFDDMAGLPGFEPGDGGIKTRCLTAWL